MDSTTILIAAVFICFFLASGVGANDLANAMGTSVGAKALTVKRAVIIAAIFEACGAFFAGGEVTKTISEGIINLELFKDDPQIFITGMLACSLATATWLLLASCFGWPVSTTHSIIGAILGFGILQMGFSVVRWKVMVTIFLSWVISPVMAGLLAFLLFYTVQRTIFNTLDPLRYAKRYVPIYVFATIFIIMIFTLTKGLNHLHLKPSASLCLLIAGGIAFCGALIACIPIHMIKYTSQMDKAHDFKKVESVFAVLMIFTACTMAFAHGSNDVANAIGPLAAILEMSALQGGQTPTHPTWIFGLGAAGIVFGLATYGYKVIATIGEKITVLTPSRGFAAELAAASTVVLASYLGLPISTTHALVGAVLGVGMARGIAALNLQVIRQIVISWLITLPMGVLLVIWYFGLLTLLL